MEVGDKQAALLVFISDNSFSTDTSTDAIRAIVADYQKRMPVYLVHSRRGARPDSTKELAEKFKLGVPVLLDARLTLTRKVGARVTPEAIVIGHTARSSTKDASTTRCPARVLGTRQPPPTCATRCKPSWRENPRRSRSMRRREQKF